jgi:hypothetical protein
MAFTMVTSCPLCLALSDPEDMLDIEIDRFVPKGRAHVLLCRSCGSQVVRAMAKAGEPLAQELIDLDNQEAERPPASAEAKELPASEPVVQEPTGRSAQGAAGTPEEPSDDNSAA